MSVVRLWRMAMAGVVGVSMLLIGTPARATGLPPSVDEAFMWTDLGVCARSAPGAYLHPSTFSPPTLRARVRDADTSTSLTVEMALWPTDNPADSTVLTASGWADFVSRTEAPRDYVDGQTYSWAARVTDGESWSAWSSPCYFTVDAVFPTAPTATVVSKTLDGQQYHPGRPLKIRMDPNGVTDIVGYEFTWMGVFSVSGCDLGPYGVIQNCTDRWAGPLAQASPDHGPVTATLSPPGPGYNRLEYRSVDRAGTVSESTSIDILVAPWTSVSTTPSQPAANTRFRLALRSPERVAGFVVKVDGCPSRVLSSADGHSASLTLRLAEGAHPLVVRHLYANGRTGHVLVGVLYVGPPA
jgi:hypothetical protein